MARLAALLSEASVMRIAVAVRTLSEGQSQITRFVVRSGYVALLTSHSGMQPGKWVSGLGVIELLRHAFPVVVVMALEAVLTKSALVWILMTGRTSGRNTEEGPAQIRYLDQMPFGGCDVLWTVTGIATESDMLAFKGIPGLFVIELFQVPFDQGKFSSVVLRVAARTLMIRLGFDSIESVQSAV